MRRGDGVFLSGAVIAIVLAVIFGALLQPTKPKLAGDSGYQEQPTSYRAGGSSCEPAKIRALPAKLRSRKADACAEAEEQHRRDTNSLIENRRAAVAADASAIYTYAQARIEAWGAAIGLLTLLAAVAAASFAKKAADHTEDTAAEARTANQIAREDTRPILAFEGIGWEQSVGGHADRQFAHFRWSNVGKRPVRFASLEIVRLETEAGADQPDWETVFSTGHPIVAEPAGLIIMPDAKHESIGVPMSPNRFFFMGHGPMRSVYLAARAVYTNAISGEHEREFITRVAVQIFPLVVGGPPAELPEGIDWPTEPLVLQAATEPTGDIVGYKMQSISAANAVHMT